MERDGRQGGREDQETFVVRIRAGGVTGFGGPVVPGTGGSVLCGCVVVHFSR